MNSYNYNEGKTSAQRKAIKIFKTWFDSDGICQFSYRCNRKTNYFIQYPVYTDSDGTSSLEVNIDEFQQGRLSGRINRKDLQNKHIDYYIDFVCVHKGNPIYGFIIEDNDTQTDFEILKAFLDERFGFELYLVNADWIIYQTTKPNNIACEKVRLTD